VIKAVLADDQAMGGFPHYVEFIGDTGQVFKVRAVSWHDAWDCAKMILALHSNVEAVEWVGQCATLEVLIREAT